MTSSYQLIVTEKPSVARDIAKVLGIQGKGKGVLGRGAIRITWCLGHLVELAEPGDYDSNWRGWRLEALPMLPEEFKLKARKDTEDQWRVVRDLLRDSSLGEVVNACDAGREGELIFANVYHLSGCKKSVKRLWISSMTTAAIRKGFESLREGAEMKSLEAAARCRSEADWLVGLNATRAMTVRMQDGGPRRGLLSLGRVQTPTLALIVVREEAIDAFKVELFWQVKVQLQAEGGSWQALWTNPEVKKQPDRLHEKVLAEEIAARLSGGQGEVTRVQRKESREKAPLLYDLTTLQKEANKRFKFSAKKTLDLAQALYERHKVLTYPRTDSRHLGSDQVAGLPDGLRALTFGPYEDSARSTLERWPVTLSKRVIDDKEVSDHHAIIPTGEDPRRGGLSVDEKRIFDLVARRFLAVFQADAVFATVEVDTQVGEDLLAARGRTCLEPGWRTIDPPKMKKKEETLLPPLEVGATATVTDILVHEGKTKPPKRYTEATLLGAMERAGEGLEDAELKRAMKRSGLGTPATRAAIIETLIRRTYVERRDNQLVPTGQGRSLLGALPVEALRSPRLTGEWEARLSAIAEGAEEASAFMTDIRGFTSDVVGKPGQAEVSVALREMVTRARPSDGPSVGACPLCEGEVRPVRGDKGWACAGDSCHLYIPSQVARRPLSMRMVKALLSKREAPAVKGFKSREGKDFTAALRIDDEGKVVFHFPQPESLGECPACTTPVRGRGKVFTCETGRDCPFVVFGEMSGRKMNDPEVKQLLVEGKTAVLAGFRPRDGGEPFAARLVWSGSRVVVERADPRSEEGSVGACPRCQSEVHFARNSWRCSEASCEFKIRGEVAGRLLDAMELRGLLSEGRTPRFHGFRHSRGTFFKASLVLDPEKGVKFDYSKEGGLPDPPLPSGSPRPAFGAPLDCPTCVGGGERHPGYIVAGRSAWGCSRWRTGCSLRVPFEIEGAVITDADAQTLFSKKRKTGTLRTASGKELGTVSLEPGTEPCWRLDAFR